MLGSHTAQQQLRVCFKTAKQAVLIPALLVPGGFGISLPICVDSGPRKKVESAGILHPRGCSCTEHRVISSCWVQQCWLKFVVLMLFENKWAPVFSLRSADIF